MSNVATERVVLLDEAGNATGDADKYAVHHASTPLHLAFSCYVLDGSGRLLVTQRALSKATFPGVWTNTCCGHPAPGEAIEDAVTRRVHEELGISLHDLRLVLPAFRYTALMDNGVLENEMCPVFVARVSGSADGVRADPAEVEEHRWEPWTDFRASVLTGRDVSSWCREQVAQLPADLASASARPRSELPAAAR
jgi:isopentenyl-diphosphate delta-isomerase